MLRGLRAVVSPSDLVVGEFYMQPFISDDLSVFMRVQLPNSGGAEHWDLHFRQDDGHGLWFLEPRGYAPVLALPPVHIRVDPFSMAESEFDAIRRPGMLCVSGTDAFVVGGWKTGTGSTAVNLSSGEASYTLPSGWRLFKKWSLVVDDGEKEVALVKFDRTAPN